MADFEDANSPTWENMFGGQQNLVDAIEGTISFESPDSRRYRLGDEVATLITAADPRAGTCPRSTW